jgi:polyisoprenoid-binding protein YceI
VVAWLVLWSCSTEPTVDSSETTTAGIAAPSWDLAPALVMASARVEPEPSNPPHGLVLYELTPSTTGLLVVVRVARDSFAAEFAQDHVVSATRYSGQFLWDPAHPERCDIEVSVPTSGLRADLPAARVAAGLKPIPSDDSPQIERNIHGRRQLESDLFPTITFRSTSCAVVEGDQVDVSGDLSVHGVSRPTTARMTIHADRDRFTARGTFTAYHADFGIKPFSGAMGAVRNAEPLEFVLDLSGARQGATSAR